jgi:8-oxo-dGTP pyrophosphatase MutT (NUDIX family)
LGLTYSDVLYHTLPNLSHICTVLRFSLLLLCLIVHFTSHDIPMLKKALEGPLPGLEEQLKLAHDLRATELAHMRADEDSKVAGVVLLLFRAEDEQIKTVLIARSLNPRDVHSGQISFPGGRIEPKDKNIETGALRELYEEVGVAPHEVDVLGALTEVYIPISNFLVFPFVAYASKTPDFRAQETEVISILTPDLGLFLEPNQPERKEMTMSNGFKLGMVPYFDVEGHVLWGATAMMLGELRAVVRSMPSLAPFSVTEP